MKLYQKNNSSQRGAALATVLVITMLLLIVLHHVISRYYAELTMTNQTYRKYQSLNIAEAGIQKALYELKQSNRQYTGEKNTSFANGYFTIQIRPVDSLSHHLTVTGVALPESRYIQKTVIQTTVKNENGKLKIILWREE